MSLMEPTLPTSLPIQSLKNFIHISELEKVKIPFESWTKYKIPYLRGVLNSPNSPPIQRLKKLLNLPVQVPYNSLFP